MTFLKQNWLQLKKELTTPRGKLLGFILVGALIFGIFIIVQGARDPEVNISSDEVFSLIIVIPIVAGLVYALRNRSNPFVSKWIRRLGWIIFIAWILSFGIKGFR